MLVRVALLFLVFSAAMYFFISFFHSITRSQWKIAGKLSVKIAVSIIFAIVVITTCGVISHATN